MKKFIIHFLALTLSINLCACTVAPEATYHPTGKLSDVAVVVPPENMKDFKIYIHERMPTFSDDGMSLLYHADFDKDQDITHIKISSGKELAFQVHYKVDQTSECINDFSFYVKPSTKYFLITGIKRDQNDSLMKELLLGNNDQCVVAVGYLDNGRLKPVKLNKYTS